MVANQEFAEFEKIKARVAALEEENEKLKEASDSTATDILNLQTTAASTCHNMAATNDEVNSLKEEALKLRRRNIRLEAYTRRESIKIFGMKEAAGESNEENAEELVRELFKSKMEIPREKVENIRFERVHRIPSRRDRSRSKQRPMIAKFSFYQDKEYIWSFVKNLRGTKIEIANDFPKEIDKIHETLYPVLKRAKQAKQTAFFKVDKLTINGQIYRGEETENLAHCGLIMNSD